MYQENSQFDSSFVMEKYSEEYASDRERKSSSEHLLRSDPCVPITPEGVD